MYKIKITDRSYSNWSICKEDNQPLLSETSIDFDKDVSVHTETILHMNACEQRLFSGDTFNINGEGICDIIRSPVRSTANIPGVLILKNNKTYGRTKEGKGKLLYKCVPDNPTIPTFLVPYEMKTMGFFKVFANIYITFQFKDWTNTDKHPIGTINQVIGSVDELPHFYEYQLYCKQLNISLQKFNKDTSKCLQNYSHMRFKERVLEKYPTVEDRTGWRIFTIDPENSKDFDDGFSIRRLDTGQIQLSIYIANVVQWIEILDLWESFSSRVATIYLPDSKKPMLPAILSDFICSLGEKTSRFAFVMDLFINTENYEIKIVDIKYSNCIIQVYKNYVYEEPKLLKDPNYILLTQVVQKLSEEYKYIPIVRDSHEVVCYLMTLMNYYCAKELLRNKNGIFRAFAIKDKGDNEESKEIPNEISSFIKIWNSHSSGQYVLYKDPDPDQAQAQKQFISHEIMGLDAYTHITSPIRRMVDLLNMIQFQINMGLVSLSEKAILFHQTWLKEIEYINASMKSIRRVQNDCALLYLCTDDPSIVDTEYQGYIFDKKLKSNGFVEYMVYLPYLKITSRIKTKETDEIWNNYESKNFKLFVFHDEDRFKKKIRLQIA